MAHRGSRYLTAENTLLGHREAHRLGASVLETDVRVTTDNQVVLHHDINTIRTTGSSHVVHESSLATLKQLDAGFMFTHDNGTTYPFRGKGLTIPTLDEFLDAFPDAAINIEIKRNNVSDAVRLLQVLEARGDASLRDRLVFTSRWCDPLQSIRDRNEAWATAACEAEIPVFLLLGFLRLAPVLSRIHHNVLRLPFVPRADVLQIPTVSGVASLLSPTIIDAIHSFGMKVHYWVMNDKDSIMRAIEMGADGVITDRFDLGLEALAELGLAQPISAAAMKASNLYVPAVTPEEVHTCITATCQLFAIVDPALFFGATGLTILCALVWLSYFIVPASVLQAAGTKRKAKQT